MEFAGADDIDGKPEGVSDGKLRINFGGDDVESGKIRTVFE
jgi:hypothetical protein